MEEIIEQINAFENDGFKFVRASSDAEDSMAFHFSNPAELEPNRIVRIAKIDVGEITITNE